MLIVCETPRLLLRTWQIQDLPALANLLGESVEDGCDLMAEEPGSQAENELWRFQAEMDKWGWSRWAVVLTETHQLIGYCGFSPYGRDIEMGWRFLPEFRGQGLIYEAAEAVTQFGFKQLGIRRIISFSRPDNAFAQGVMQQLGMTLDCFEGWSTCTVARYSMQAPAYSPARPPAVLTR